MLSNIVQVIKELFHLFLSICFILLLAAIIKEGGLQLFSICHASQIIVTWLVDMLLSFVFCRATYEPPLIQYKIVVMKYLIHRIRKLWKWRGENEKKAAKEANGIEAPFSFLFVPIWVCHLCSFLFYVVFCLFELFFYIKHFVNLPELMRVGQHLNLINRNMGLQ